MIASTSSVFHLDVDQPLAYQIRVRPLLNWSLETEAQATGTGTTHRKRLFRRTQYFCKCRWLPGLAFLVPRRWPL